MKNLLIYLSPQKKFNQENEKYIKIQIDNSLKYWRLKDIILATNFPYEYHDVHSIIVPDDLHNKHSVCINKVNVIIYLLENKILKDLTWFHDTEAWQLALLDLKLSKDLGLTDYGWNKKWNGGSIFFKQNTLDIFKLWQKSIYNSGKDDEKALMRLTRNNVNNINERIQRLNIAYNLGKRHIQENLIKADRPIKVAHFHPYRQNLLKKFMPLLPKSLIRLFYENFNHGQPGVYRF